MEGASFSARFFCLFFEAMTLNSSSTSIIWKSESFVECGRVIVGKVFILPETLGLSVSFSEATGGIFLSVNDLTGVAMGISLVAANAEGMQIIRQRCVS